MICRGCEEDKDESAFPVRNDRSGRLRPYCKLCANDVNRNRYANYKRTSPFKLRAIRLKLAAKRKQVPFDLDADYLESIWTGICPVLKEPIYLYERSQGDEFAAEVDRIVPVKGYIKDNVAYLSRRANRLKNNVTSVELLQLYNWLKEQEDKN